MMTPIREPANASHRSCNKAHASVQNGIEQVFGQWKREFMQLKYVSRVALDRAPQIIIACAVLHNIRKQRHQIEIGGAPKSDDEEEDEEVGIEADRRHQLNEEAVDAMH
jgi:hypothetical protein